MTKTEKYDAYILAVVVLVFLCCWKAFGQDTKPPEPISDKEKIAILQAQKEALASQQALQNTAEYRQAVAAQEAVRKLGNDVFTSRKIQNTDWALCDGPSVGSCQSVEKGDIALRPVLKPKAEPKK